MRPWETWIRKGSISRRQAETLLEQMERQQLDPFGLDFGVRRVRLAGGTKVKLIINKTGLVPYFIAKGKIQSIAGGVDILPDILEHGILVIPASYTIPLTIYTTLELEAYLSGDGSVNPATEQNEYPIGIGVESGLTCNGGADAAMTWTTDASNYLTSYLSEVYSTVPRVLALLADTNRVYPELWTGLSRLFAQVIGGSGKTISALLKPISWIPNYKTDGLVRLWDEDQESHRYWYVRITETSGVRAIELTAGIEGKCALAWLAAHELGTLTLNDDDLLYYEAWVLRSLSLNGTADEILSAESIADVYTDSASSLAHGWQWNRAGNIAKIITHGWTGSEWTATTATITFSISTGSLIAGIVTSTNGWTPNCYAPLWVPSADNINLLEKWNDTGACVGTGDNTPVYGWWDGDDNWQTINHLTTESTSSSYAEPFQYVDECCGAQTNSHKYVKSSTSHRFMGGWSLSSGGGPPEPAAYTSKSIDYAEISVTSSGGFVTSYHWTSTKVGTCVNTASCPNNGSGLTVSNLNKDPAGWCEWTENPPTPLYPPYDRPPSRYFSEDCSYECAFGFQFFTPWPQYQVGSLTAYARTTDTVNGSGNMCAWISPRDPTVVGVVARQAHEGGTWAQRSATNANVPVAFKHWLGSMLGAPELLGAGNYGNSAVGITGTTFYASICQIIPAVYEEPSGTYEGSIRYDVRGFGDFTSGSESAGEIVEGTIVYYGGSLPVTGSSETWEASGYFDYLLAKGETVTAIHGQTTAEKVAIVSTEPGGTPLQIGISGIPNDISSYLYIPIGAV